jgi:hypothetical protein
MRLYELLAEADEFKNPRGNYSTFGIKSAAEYRQETRDLRGLDNTMAAELPAGVPVPPPLPKTKEKEIPVKIYKKPKKKKKKSKK